MIKNTEQIYKAAEYIKNIIKTVPETALVLGTGLGYFADFIENKQIIPYKEIPHFPVSTAPDHAGQLVVGNIGEKSVMIMQGRIHYYEGYSMDEVVFPIRVMKALGIKNLFLTNAAGSVNLDYRVGDLVILNDHIKFFSFGPRFNDMSDAYTKKLREMAKTIAKSENIPIREGVYSYMPGPSFETPAEIRMLRTLGADVVGMSTVPEVLCAAHSGMKIFAVSFVTNLAAGILDEIKELEYTDDSKDNFNRLIKGMIAQV